MYDDDNEIRSDYRYDLLKETGELPIHLRPHRHRCPDDANPHYWIGLLATAIGQTLREPDRADQILRPVARSLAASAVIATDALRHDLIRNLERKQRV